MFIINIPGARDHCVGEKRTKQGEFVGDRGLLGYLYFGVEKVIYPPLIFLGIGAMTDFGPLIANPKSMLIGAAAQLGVFLTFVGAVLLGFDAAAAASIAIIGGADGPDCNLFDPSVGRLYQRRIACNNRYRGVFVHGTHTDHTETVDEMAYNEKRARDQNETVARGY